MMSGNWKLHLLFCFIFLWRFCRIKAYVDVCESVTGTLYCNCEQASYKESDSLYRVSCIILQTISDKDPVWRSIGDSENISYLTLQPRLPIKFDYIPSEELKRMSNLKILRIKEASLGTLKSYALSGFKNLIELEIEGNEITALEPNAIDDMPKLKKLAMSENFLQELLADSLKDLLDLESLFLDRNNISRIEACAFCNLQNLKELELWGNQISDLTEYTFRGLRYLRRLDLARNKIRILNDKVFHSMPRLVELDLRENMISHIASRAFVGLEKLQSLALGNNNIKVLPNEVFSPLVNARSVDVNYNELEVLQREVVDNMKKSKESAFSVSFNANPLKCDCALRWILTHLKLNQSHRFMRELTELKCKLENENEKQNVVEYLKTVDCKMSDTKPKDVPPVLSPNLGAMTTVSVPIELNSQKSKKSAVVTEDEAETYLSDVEQKASVEGNGSDSLHLRWCLVYCLGLLIYFLQGM